MPSNQNCLWIWMVWRLSRAKVIFSYFTYPLIWEHFFVFTKTVALFWNYYSNVISVYSFCIQHRKFNQNSTLLNHTDKKANVEYCSGRNGNKKCVIALLALLKLREKKSKIQNHFILKMLYAVSIACLNWEFQTFAMFCDSHVFFFF